MAERYSSDFEAGEDNTQVFGLDIHTPVFLISSSLIIAFVIATLQYPEIANSWLSNVRLWCLTNFDSFMMVAVNALLIFCLALIISPMGKIRLGGDSARPEFGRLSWFAMLFAAGMGIGLMF